MLGRVVHSVDYQRVLATAPTARSAHFAIHHVADAPSRAYRNPAATNGEKLSTANVTNGHRFVDKCNYCQWFGIVISKRLVRRAVTRQLLKRQVRAAVQRHATQLPAGMWVLRLRSAFDRRHYVSAASKALRQAVRTELDELLDAAAAAARH